MTAPFTPEQMAAIRDIFGEMAEQIAGNTSRTAAILDCWAAQTVASARGVCADRSALADEAKAAIDRVVG